MQQWFVLPDLYMALNSQAARIKFAKAYMRKNFPKWQHKTLQGNRVLAELVEEGE